MTNPYKRMYVLTEDEYQLYKSTLHETNQPAPVKCPEDGREFPNANMLGHHLKTHVNGLQCNLCGKVFKTKRALTAHLKRHPPQVQPSTHSVFDNASPAVPQTVPENIPIKPKKVHKQRSTVNFTSTHWLTLK